MEQFLAGRYRVGASVGCGGAAVVHRGFDRKLRRPVAIKTLHGSATAGPVLAEARAAARLSHPNVARVYDYGETGAKTPYLVMEYVSGGTLADRLKRDGPLPFAEAAAVCADVASALAAAHAHGIVHRDIKPRNVMLGPGGAKVVDFGVAAPAGAIATGADGRIWGTPLYLAPEQLRGERSFPPADVFALGLLLHECLTGSSPWRGACAEQVLVDRHLRPVPALPGARDCPAGFADFYRRCLAPLPAKRPTAAEAALALRRFAEGRPQPARPAWRTAPRAVAAACLAAAVLIGLAVAQLSSSEDQGDVRQRPSIAATASQEATPTRRPADA